MNDIIVLPVMPKPRHVFNYEQLPLNYGLDSQPFNPNILVFPKKSLTVVSDPRIIIKIKNLFRKIPNLISFRLNKIFLAPRLAYLSEKSAIVLANRTVNLISKLDTFFLRPMILSIFIIHKSTLIIKFLYLKKKRTKVFYFDLLFLLFAFLALVYPSYPFLTLNLNGNLKFPIFLSLTILYDVACHIFEPEDLKKSIQDIKI